ncbi:MAG: hypothetical protein KAJ19_12600 [Gammaproteobacteria bacterium]|nr:hypothetical protein [Gammaproteobacteria bacterium]
MDDLQIYSEIFPSIDREVIKLILEELKADEVLDALLDISKPHYNPDPDPQTVWNNDVVANLEPNSNSDNFNDITESHAILSPFYLEEEEQPQGFFSRLFNRRRRHHTYRYDPDDDL